MPNAAEFIQIIKKAALEAVKADNPVEIRFGQVTNVNPLQIAVEQKLTLGATQLVLSRHVTDYQTRIGEEITTIYNGLAIGDHVILLRQQGGQKYIVWDRAV